MAFGFNGSFVAWDGYYIRWHGVHPKLEAQLQEWLAASHTFGRLRFVCLGHDESFLAVTESGSWACEGLPQEMYEFLQRGDQRIIGHSIMVRVDLCLLEGN